MEQGLAVTYSAIMTLAMIPIYIGSHLSIHMKDEQEEVLTAQKAAKFPIIASGVLFGLYLLFKYFSKEYVNLLLTTYFLALGFVSVVNSLVPVLVWILGDPKLQGFSINVPNVPYVIDAFKWKFNAIDIGSWILSGIVLGFYVQTKHWVLNNILGMSFCIQGIATFSVGNYKVACILLSGLFFYDIFWVFGTDVMVTVAKSFDVPLKFLFPKDLWAEELKFSMLGLGDVVLPGVLIALLLRYDVHRAKDAKNVKKTYFNVSMVSYFIGLASTIIVMHTFKAAQPALLYLVPALLIGSIGTALVLGDVDGLLSYEEEGKEEDSDSGKKSKKD